MGVCQLWQQRTRTKWVKQSKYKRRRHKMIIVYHEGLIIAQESQSRPKTEKRLNNQSMGTIFISTETRHSNGEQLYTKTIKTRSGNVKMESEVFNKDGTSTWQLVTVTGHCQSALVKTKWWSYRHDIERSNKVESNEMEKERTRLLLVIDQDTIKSEHKRIHNRSIGTTEKHNANY